MESARSWFGETAIHRQIGCECGRTTDSTEMTVSRCMHGQNGTKSAHSPHIATAQLLGCCDSRCELFRIMLQFRMPQFAHAIDQRFADDGPLASNSFCSPDDCRAWGVSPCASEANPPVCVRTKFRVDFVRGPCSPCRSFAGCAHRLTVPLTERTPFCKTG